MYIELRSINRIGNGAIEFQFCSDIVRYIELNECAVFLLKDNSVISLVTEINGKYIVSWKKEFTSDIISSFSRYEENGKIYIRIIINSDYLYVISPCSGEIIYETPTKF